MNDQMTLTVTLPADNEALAMLGQLAESVDIKGSQAGNLIALKAWLGQLPERLGMEIEEPDKAA
jgi:hypothetical protein